MTTAIPPGSPLALPKMPLLATAWHGIPPGSVETRIPITPRFPKFRNQVFRKLAVSGSSHGCQPGVRAKSVSRNLESAMRTPRRSSTRQLPSWGVYTKSQMAIVGTPRRVSAARPGVERRSLRNPRRSREALPSKAPESSSRSDAAHAIRVLTAVPSRPLFTGRQSWPCSLPWAIGRTSCTFSTSRTSRRSRRRCSSAGSTLLRPRPRCGD